MSVDRRRTPDAGILTQERKAVEEKPTKRVCLRCLPLSPLVYGRGSHAGYKKNLRSMISK